MTRLTPIGIRGFKTDIVRLQQNQMQLLLVSWFNVEFCWVNANFNPLKRHIFVSV